MILNPRMSERRPASLPMTPMIDVVFLLLIFFLVTARFAEPESSLASGLAVEGPTPDVSDLQPQTVEVRTEQGEPVYVVGERTVRSQRALRAILLALPKGPGVTVRANPGVSVEWIAAAMQAADDAGFEKRSYVPGN